MHSEKLHKKLLKYGSLVAAVAGINEAEAAIVYTDIVPDFAGAVGSQYFLDLNNDGTNDYRIWHDGFSNLYVSPLAATNNVLGSGGATFAYPFALSLNAPIGPGGVTFYNNGFAGGFQSLNYGSCNFGSNWCNETDKYLGFQFNIGANTHYGWARLDVNQNGSSWTVKDYAYEDTPNTAILAGDFVSVVSADPASNIIGSDIANNGNGLDLEVVFNAAANEITLSEYRVIAVKASSVGAFNLAAASALPASNYSAVIPMGLTSYTQVLSAGSLDSDGDLIASGIPYTIYVLSVADGVNATADDFDSSAFTVTLNTPADLATTIVATDVADNSNSSDFSVTFNAATNENSVDEYRVICVRSSSASSFNLTAAQALGATRYTAVAPTGGPYNVTPTATLDSDGNTIVIGVSYNFFILSVADGMVANIDNLSAISNSETLNTPAPSANVIVATDVADNSNGQDIEVTFDAANSEVGISTYRIFVVKDVSTAGFTLANALNLGANFYKEVIPNGGPYTEILNANQKDSDGFDIVVGQPYSIFVLSITNGTIANVSSIASSANTLTLNSPTSGASNVVGTDIADFANASDVRVDFDAAPNESGIAEYRVMVVKEANVPSFDVTAAENVAFGDYAKVTPNGSANYTRIFTVSAQDTDGDDIIEGVTYQAFVLSVGDGVIANISNLTSPSDTFTLKSPPPVVSGINDVLFQSANVFVDGSKNIVIELSADVIRTSVKARLYNLLGMNIRSENINEQRSTLEASQLTNGIYLLVLENNEGATRTIKLILK